MKVITFNYQGKTYSGELIASTNMQPHYYWLSFNDSELKERIGESIAFMQNGDRIELVYTVTNNQDIVDVVKMAVAEKLQLAAQ